MSSPKEKAERFRALHSYFINARTDGFFQAPPEEHGGAMLETALERARAYAGADGLFVPGLTDAALIARLAAALERHGRGQAPTQGVLARLGVARVSHGPRPYLAAMRALESAARDAARAE